MKLKNDEKRWLVKGTGGLLAMFIAGLRPEILGIAAAVAIWYLSLFLVARWGLGKEND